MTPLPDILNAVANDRIIRLGPMVRDDLRKAAQRIRWLESWREQALEVLERWDKVAELVPGMEPGVLMSEATADYIKRLESENARLRAGWPVP